ncbi:ATP-binding protein, partial [Pyxidicoccus sp. 3LFB2]
LIRELRRRAGPGDLVLEGKFNQLRGNVPYAAFVEAFEGLIHQLEEKPPEARDAWRRRLRDALGPNGRVICDILPGLEALLGPQPEPLKLEPVEAAARLHLLFQSFVQALASAEHVLVLFLEDLQWADSGSLQLLHHLAMDPDSRHVLVLGAYRPREVGADHPLSRMLESLRVEEAMPFETLELPPLDLPSLTALCADTFRRAPEEARPLADLLLRKTAGNPLFVTRLLRLLHHSGLLAFDVGRGVWRWDLARLEQAEVTENVVELMMATIRRLPARAQRALTVAACLGDRVELWLLSALLGDSEGDAASTLWSLLREGLLVPRKEGSKEREASYVFAHDRVRQAAYALLSEDERRRLHHEAGRWLLREGGGDALDERLFAVVDHLHLGVERPGGTVEGLELSELNFRAGLKAKATSAFSAALVYLLRGISLLPRPQWPSRREQVFRLHKEAAECAYYSGDLTLAGELVRTALEHAATRLEQADLYGLLVLAHAFNASFPEGLQWGRAGLRLFGIELPEQDFAPALAAELAEVARNMRGRAVEDLLDAPRLEDAELCASVRLLAEVSNVAYFLDPALFALINTRALNLMLKHGNSPMSPGVYGAHGMMLAAGLGDAQVGHAFASMATELGRRHGDPRQECRALISLLHLNHWKQPLRGNLPLVRRAFATGLAGGDLHFAGYALINGTSAELAMGAELPRVLGSIDTCLNFFRKSGQLPMRDTVILFRQAIRALQGHTRLPARFDDNDFDEQSFLRAKELANLNRALLGMLRLQVAYLLGDFDEALRMSELAGRYAMHLQGSHRMPEYNCMTSLALAARSHATPEARAEALARIADNQRELGTWAERSPENFRHKHQLVAAEVARVEGRSLEAMALYDSAIDGAHAEGFLQDEALANELAGRCYHSLGRARFASLHLRAALDAYARWGAWAKVSLLEEEFPALKPVGHRAWSEPAPVRGGAPGATLDL